MGGYSQVDDGIADHPKVLELLEHPDGLAALGLWTACLTWARRQVEHQPPDRWGTVPATLPRRFGAAEQLAGLLVEARAGHEHGLWEANGSGWRIHDFTDWQDIDGLLARKARGRRNALKKWHPDQPDLWGSTAASSPGSSPGGTASSTASRNAQDRTGQDRKLPQDSSSSLARFGEFWEVYPRRVGRQAAELKWRTKVAEPGVDPDLVIAAAARLRDKPGRDPKYTPHPATWLNQGRWEDQDDDDPGGSTTRFPFE